MDTFNVILIYAFVVVLVIISRMTPPVVTGNPVR